MWGETQCSPRSADQLRVSFICKRSYIQGSCRQHRILGRARPTQRNSGLWQAAYVLLPPPLIPASPNPSTNLLSPEIPYANTGPAFTLLGSPSLSATISHAACSKGLSCCVARAGLWSCPRAALYQPYATNWIQTSLCCGPPPTRPGVASSSIGLGATGRPLSAHLEDRQLAWAAICAY